MSPTADPTFQAKSAQWAWDTSTRRRKSLFEEAKPLNKRSTVGNRISFLILEQFSFVSNNLSRARSKGSHSTPRLVLLTRYRLRRATGRVHRNRAWITCWNFWPSENLGLDKRTGKGGCKRNHRSGCFNLQDQSLIFLSSWTLTPQRATPGLQNK